MSSAFVPRRGNAGVGTGALRFWRFYKNCARTLWQCALMLGLLRIAAKAMGSIFLDADATFG